MARPTKKIKSLYWSSLSCYEDCPQKFGFKYGIPGVDQGGGVGRPKPVPERRSEHHMIMGTVIQEVIEAFYNNELWKAVVRKEVTAKELAANLKQMTSKVFDRETSDEGRFIDWRNAPAPLDLLETCVKGVLGYLRTMRAHHLIGEWARAEYRLLGFVDDKTPIGGIADVIIRRDKNENNPDRPATGITIIDGKNSKHKGRYSSPDQLRWYALLLYLSHGVLPDRLGFVYYRFPYGMSKGSDTDEIEEGVEWVEWDKNDLRGLAQRAVDARRAIGRKEFEARPSPPMCKFCDWEDVCPQRQAQKEANRRKRKPKGKKKVDPSLDVEGGDFKTIGFK